MKIVCLLALFWIQVFRGAAMPTCCNPKTVGGVEYILLVGEEAGPNYSTVCLSDCVYKKKNDADSGDKYCFGAGKLTVECGDKTEQGPYLFMGPGYKSNQSELLTLPGLTPATCSIPRHPKGDVYGYVATLSEGGPILCGGTHSDAWQRDCYFLTENGSWIGTPPMQAKRGWASSVRIGGAWWVTGGFDGPTWVPQATTELYENNTWHAHTNLPEAMAFHCMLQVNSSHVLLTGGYTNNGSSAATYLYSDNTGFIRQPDMITARSDHGCLLTDGYALIAGGVGNGTMMDKVEYFSFSTLSWQSGPSLPVATRAGAMITIKEGTLYLGGENNNKIFLMEKNGSSINQWQWQEMGEMSPKAYFSAMIMKDMYGCNN